MNLEDFIARNWVWLTFLIVATPLLSIVGWHWLRAWQLSLGAWMKGVPLGVVDLLLMGLRGIDTTLLINQLIVAKQSGLTVDPQQLAIHHMAGGNMRVVIAALLSAKRFNLPLSFERAAAVDLVGHDPLQLITDAVHEANKISPIVNPDAKAGVLATQLVPAGQRQAINPASVLLQAAPGTTGTIAHPPLVTASVAFTQGQLDVVVRGQALPRAGDAVRVVTVDGMTVVVEPVPAG
jgi:hypothetical protein